MLAETHGEAVSILNCCFDALPLVFFKVIVVCVARAQQVALRLATTPGTNHASLLLRRRIDKVSFEMATDMR